MTRYRLTIEFDGRPFVGWQRQENGASVQGALEAAILALSGEATSVHGAGRTDAGVHAAAMTAHFDLARPMPAFRLKEALTPCCGRRLSPSSPAPRLRRIFTPVSIAPAAPIATASSTAARR